MNTTDVGAPGVGYRAFHGALIHTAADLSRLSAAANTAQLHSLAIGADERLAHLAEGNFVVAVIGAFKRGKSTLVNALLGDEIMPADILPTTATLNRVIYGRETRATVKMRDGSSHAVSVDGLSQYVTKLTEDAAKRAREIEEAVIEHPTYLCANNVQLLDTPGLGDEEAMTALTESVLSKIDAAIFVVSATTAMSDSELADLDRLLQHVDPSCVTVAVTRMDQVPDENDRERVLKVVRKRSAPLLGQQAAVFGVAALFGLQAKQERDDKALKASGLSALEDWLEDFLVRESGFALLRAANETILSLAGELGEQITERLEASDAADETRQARLAALEANLDDIEKKLGACQAEIAGWEKAGSGWRSRRDAGDELTDGRRDLLTAIARLPVSGMLTADRSGTIEKLTENHVDDLKNMARTSVPKLSSADVENPDARHRRVREAVNPRLKALFNRKVDGLSKVLIDEVALLRIELAQLWARWDNAFQIDLATPEGQSKELVVINDSRFAQADIDLKVHHESFNTIKTQFSEHFDARCDYVSMSGAMNRWLSNLTNDGISSATVNKVEEDSRVHAAEIASSAYYTGYPQTAGKNYMKNCGASLKPIADKLEEDIKIRIAERKWILRLQREQMQTARVREVEPLKLSCETARDVQAQAQARRRVLQQLAIVSNPETGE